MPYKFNPFTEEFDYYAPAADILTALKTVDGADSGLDADLLDGEEASAFEDAGSVATHAALTATHGATGAVVGTTNTQTLTNKTLTAAEIATSLDFNSLKAIAMVCDNGAILPTSPSPVAGQWFLHTPTGRKFLHIYDGSNWIPVFSLGVATINVDKTDGTDAKDYGFGPDADAVKTIQQAIDLIPAIVGGTIDIYLTAENYAETVTIRGKNFGGNYFINIRGEFTIKIDEATYDTMTQGGSAVQGVINDANAFASDVTNMLIEVPETTGADYRVIDGHCWSLGYDVGGVVNGAADEPSAGEILIGATSGAIGTHVSHTTASGAWGDGDAAGVMTIHKTFGTFQDNEEIDRYDATSSQTKQDDRIADVDTGAGNAVDDDNLIIVGCFTSDPDTKTYSVYDWGTTVTAFVVTDGQKQIRLFDLETGAITISGMSKLRIDRCSVTGTILCLSLSIVVVYESVISAAALPFYVYTSSSGTVYRSKAIVTGASIAANTWGSAAINVMLGSVVDGVDPGNNGSGCVVYNNSIFNTYDTAAAGYVRIRNLLNGIAAYQGGMAFNTATNQYSGNTTPESATAGTYGYID